jgi:hypothetical protein
LYSIFCSKPAPQLNKSASRSTDEDFDCQDASLMTLQRAISICQSRGRFKVISYAIREYAGESERDESSQRSLRGGAEERDLEPRFESDDDA